ncbi:hypothetical protein TNCV_2424181 [Trichonephila clavipes]|nr:hypothetical protein TNCV_2424181 [Trichonephila clavipes]
MSVLELYLENCSSGATGSVTLRMQFNLYAGGSLSSVYQLFVRSLRRKKITSNEVSKEAVGFVQVRSKSKSFDPGSQAKSRVQTLYRETIFHSSIPQHNIVLCEVFLTHLMETEASGSAEQLRADEDPIKTG